MITEYKNNLTKVIIISVCIASVFGQPVKGEDLKPPNELVKELLKKEIKADQLKQDVQEKWEKNQQFREELETLIVEACRVAYFGKETEGMAWGGGMVLLFMPRNILIDTIVPRMGDGGVLEGIFKRDGTDELLRYIEQIRRISSDEPSFNVYANYIIRHGIDESKPLINHMMQRDLKKTTVKLLDILQNRKIGDSIPDKIEKRIKSILVTAQALEWELEVDSERIVETKGKIEKLTKCDFWWVRLFAKEIQNQQILD